MNKPKISVIMGIYNCEKYLSESIESILCQTFDNWELIMCDDGSRDRTFEIAMDYQKKYPEKIKVIKNKNNYGLNYTLNKCLDLAQGEYIARQDGDDISLPHRFEKEVKFLDENSDYALVGTWMVLFDESGDWGSLTKVSYPTKDSFIQGTPFFHATCMIRKNILKEVKGYSVDNKLLRVEDYHLWLKIYSKGYKGYNICEYLYKMRDDRDASNRRTLQNRINEIRVKWMAFRNLKISPIYYIYILKPLILLILPSYLYNLLHRYKLKNEQRL